MHCNYFKLWGFGVLGFWGFGVLGRGTFGPGAGHPYGADRRYQPLRRPGWPGSATPGQMIAVHLHLAIRHDFVRRSKNDVPG